MARKDPKPDPQHRGAQKGENPRTGKPAAHAGGSNQGHTHVFKTLLNSAYPTGAHVKPGEARVPTNTYGCTCGDTEQRVGG